MKRNNYTARLVALLFCCFAFFIFIHSRSAVKQEIKKEQTCSAYYSAQSILSFRTQKISVPNHFEFRSCFINADVAQAFAKIEHVLFEPHLKPVPKKYRYLKFRHHRQARPEEDLLTA